MSLFKRLFGQQEKRKTIRITKSKLNKLMRRARIVSHNRERFALGQTPANRRRMRNARKQERRLAR